MMKAGWSLRKAWKLYQTCYTQISELYRQKFQSNLHNNTNHMNKHHNLNHDRKRWSRDETDLDKPGHDSSSKDEIQYDFFSKRLNNFLFYEEQEKKSWFSPLLLLFKHYGVCLDFPLNKFYISPQVPYLLVLDKLFQLLLKGTDNCYFISRILKSSIQSRYLPVLYRRGSS